MTGKDLLKMALQENVKVLPKNFLSDNNIKVKFLGERENPIEFGYVKVYVIMEEGELNGKVVYQY